MGRSADSQFTPANALEKALQSSSFDRYRGKTVWVEVYSLTERTGEESPEERFLRSWLGEKIISHGARMAPAKSQSEIILDVKARVFGVHQTRRDFIPLVYAEFTEGGEYVMEIYLPVLGDTATQRDLSYRGVPLYYSEDFKGSVRLIGRVRDLQGRTVSHWQEGQEAQCEDVYWMRIFGPYELQQ